MPAGSGQEKVLVIVESPTKAKTIRKFLGDRYTVEASMGHVRDLPSSASELPASVKGKPWARLAVDVENGFQPVYVVPSDKKKTVALLRKALKEADALYLATDEDREGEAIGWHLVQLLKPKIPTKRLVFHEITKTAIERALAAPRPLNTELVQAQEARRVLDRLVGYEVSPLLWKKVARGLSAGRVQSVAVRILVLRERERSAFVTSTWWDVKGQFRHDNVNFEGQLVGFGDTPIATGRDFDSATGALKTAKQVLHFDEVQARALAERLAAAPFQVAKIDQKELVRKPYPPFTTSTLQQEANRKLGFGASRTMQVAQRLYENGYITYMRTDSFNLSDEALTGIRGMVEARYGAQNLSPDIRRFTTKSKGAQEAHEAIRPAGTAMKTARELGIGGDEAKLYDLIWKRTVATQMANARIASTAVTLSATDPETGHTAYFRSTGRQVLFQGFFLAYVEGTDSAASGRDDRDQPLPVLALQQTVSCTQLDAQFHETRPPARYTTATLVKALEGEGIGRPSTYASIIDTIQRRGYVRADKKQLVPTFTAMAVTKLLEDTLGQILDVEFTASMEAKLDEIAVGADHQAYLQTFYENDLLGGVRKGEQVNPRAVCTFTNEKIDPYRVRLGKFGPFVEFDVEGADKARALTLPEDVAPADVDLPFIEALLSQADKAELPLGTDPDSGLSVYIRRGRFGPYLQLGEVTEEQPKPKRAPLPDGVDLDTLAFDTALRLLSLPRELGAHPEDGEPIRAAIGRYGPYVAHKSTFASIPKSANVLDIELAEALVLIAEKKAKSKGGAVLKELGEHPDDGAPVVVMDGRYGPYIKHKRTNVTLPETLKPDAVQLAEAVAMIAEKNAKKGKKPRKSRTTKKKATS
ncbi:MAG: type I DNA topoisomerase [Myxococcota bacterium]|nr:type I DNA topoisomerase [Myxococcota bacterium]